MSAKVPSKIGSVQVTITVQFPLFGEITAANMDSQLGSVAERLTHVLSPLALKEMIALLGRHELMASSADAVGSGINSLEDGGPLGLNELPDDAYDGGEDCEILTGL